VELAVGKLGRPALDPEVAGLAVRLEALERRAPAAPPVAQDASADPAPASQPADERPAPTAAEPPVPPPAEAPAAEAPPSTEAADVPVDLDHIGRLWPQVIEDLATNPQLHSFLADTRVLTVGEDAITVGVPSGYRVSMLAQLDQREAVEAALAGRVGHRVRLSFEQVAPPPPDERAESAGSAVPPDELQLIDEMKSMFDAVEEQDGEAAVRRGDGEKG